MGDLHETAENHNPERVDEGAGGKDELTNKDEASKDDRTPTNAQHSVDHETAEEAQN